MKSKFIIISIILLIVANIAIMYFKTYEGFASNDPVQAANAAVETANAALKTAKIAATKANDAATKANDAAKKANAEYQTVKSTPDKRIIKKARIKFENASFDASTAATDATAANDTVSTANDNVNAAIANLETVKAAVKAAVAKAAYMEGAKANAKTAVNNTADVKKTNNATIKGMLPGIDPKDYDNIYDASTVASIAYNAANKAVPKPKSKAVPDDIYKAAAAADVSNDASIVAAKSIKNNLDRIRKTFKQKNALKIADQANIASTAAANAVTAANKVVNNNGTTADAATSSLTSKNAALQLLTYFNNLFKL